MDVSSIQLSYIPQQIVNPNSTTKFEPIPSADIHLDFFYTHHLPDPSASKNVYKLNITKEELLALPRDGNISSDAYNTLPGMTLIEDAVSWHHISFGFRYGGSSTQLGAYIDYATALYELYRDYIQNNFTGDEQDAHLATVRELIGQGMEKIAESCAADLENFLGEYGFKGEKGALKESVLNLYEESFSKKLGMSLVDFGIFMSEHKSENLYTLNDILSLGFMKEASLSSVGQNIPQHLTRDDYPAKFIAYAMKKESIYNAFSVSDSTKDKIETIFFTNVNNVIDEWNNNYYKTLGWPMSSENRARIAPFDKDPILQAINIAVEDMRAGLSPQDVVEKSDYSYSFFKSDGKSTGYSYEQPTLAGRFNYFLEELGLIHRLLVTGIDWTV